VSHLDFEKYLQGASGLSCEKKALLKRVLQKNAGHILSLSQFMNDLNRFGDDSFEALPSSKKSEILLALFEAMDKVRFNSVYGEIIEIIFGEETKEGQDRDVFPKSFLALVLRKSRLTDNFSLRPLLADLLLVCSDIPVQGSSHFDYMPGLHHKDDLIRCKTLNFVYQHFGEEALPSILQQVLKMNPPPSVLFCGTLGHFFCRHPNMSWARGLKRDDLNPDKWDRKDGRWLFLKELLDSCTRIQYLSLIAGGSPGREIKQKALALKRARETSPLRLERFRVILTGGNANR
jgi:hypothetical protein